jgi:opacity protein-like surface antigen
MKRTLLLITLLCVCTAAAFAQTPKLDIFGGYSYLRSNPGFGLPSGNAHGWEASLTYNWNSWLGLKADFDGHYCCDQTLHNFLFGPQISLGHGKLTPYVHGLVGLSHGTSTGGFSDDVLGFALGGGVDWKVGHSWSWRVAQVDYLGTRFADETQDNLRISTGLVFHWGKK